MGRYLALPFVLLVLHTTQALADCSSDWKDQADCLRDASVEYQACLRRWSENPNPHVNLTEAKCAEQYANDQAFCRENCPNAATMHTNFSKISLSLTSKPGLCIQTSCGR
jgi:hypothetical protein